jgi:hypothetical protein
MERVTLFVFVLENSPKNEKMKKIIKTIAAVILMLAPAINFASGEIRGKITTNDGQPAIGAIVKILSGDEVVSGGAADFDGKYSIKPLEPGNYDVVVTYPQFKMSRIKNIEVENENAAYVDVELLPFGSDSAVVVVGTYVKPIVDPSIYTMHTMGSEEFTKLAVPRGDINAAIVAISSDIFQDPSDGGLYLRGTRKEASQYFIDGERVIGSSEIPALSIQSISVITGGIPAQYGDLTGGAIIITTKDYFSGLREKTIWKNESANRKNTEMEQSAKKNAAEKRTKEIEEEKKEAFKEF